MDPPEFRMYNLENFIDRFFRSYSEILHRKNVLWVSNESLKYCTQLNYHVQSVTSFYNNNKIYIIQKNEESEDKLKPPISSYFIFMKEVKIWSTYQLLLLKLGIKILKLGEGVTRYHVIIITFISFIFKIHREKNLKGVTGYVRQLN